VAVAFYAAIGAEATLARSMGLLAVRRQARAH